jgi:predicted nucleic acid-binding protein
MNLIDSSAWFEYFTNSSYARYFFKVIENTEELIVSPMNFFEIYKKIQAIYGNEDAIRAVGFLKNARTIEINSSISIQAAILSKAYHLHMADSILLATAQSEDAVLWTMDAHFKDIPGVQYFPKE